LEADVGRIVNANTVGAFEAKTYLGQLLDRVEHGEVIIITRHEVPIARLVPFEREIDRGRVRAAVGRLAKFSSGVRLPKGMTVKDLIDEGRP
jgi:prevent-host-death family protein